MIFATDLDRTLIFSDKFLENPACDHELVEVWQEKPISYMSKEAIKALEALQHRVHIVPITTRNEEQFKRIALFNGLITLETYVINNGGTIYHKGQEDLEWTAYIKEQINKLPLTYEEAMAYFLEVYKGPIQYYKKSDELIWLVIGDREQIDQGGIAAFAAFAREKGWNIDVNGRKIYLYPRCINKWDAISFVQKKYYNEPIIAAGDSLFDHEMVHKADLGIVPKGAYIEQECGAGIKLTEHEGLRAAEDIIGAVFEMSNK